MRLNGFVPVPKSLSNSELPTALSAAVESLFSVSCRRHFGVVLRLSFRRFAGSKNASIYSFYFLNHSMVLHQHFAWFLTSFGSCAICTISCRKPWQATCPIMILWVCLKNLFVVVVTLIIIIVVVVVVVDWLVSYLLMYFLFSHRTVSCFGESILAKEEALLLIEIDVRFCFL